MLRHLSRSATSSSSTGWNSNFRCRFWRVDGETGAGKSILVDALALALGDRADAGLVRNGCDKAEVSATFDIAACLPSVPGWRANEIDQDEGELILRRVLDAGGRSRGYINGSPSTVPSSCARSASSWSTFTGSTPTSR
jgi:DNA repair protein RecN (Recombination protein N)